jgi:hypothetical protein
MTEEIEAEPIPQGAFVPAVQPDMLSLLPEMMQVAVTAGKDGVEALERLVALSTQLRAEKAREAYFHALADFQAECPSVPKNREVSIETQGGGRYGYRFADFEQIIHTIRPHLKKYGLSYSFDTAQAEKSMTVTCKLRHLLGHVETNTFTCPVSSPSPKMSEQQKVGGTMTFAKRYALTGALGIATADDDDDGRGDEGEPEPVLDEQQIADLEARLLELGVNRAKFLRWAKVDLITEFPVRLLAEAHTGLDERKARAEKEELEKAGLADAAEPA